MSDPGERTHNEPQSSGEPRAQNESQAENPLLSAQRSSRYQEVLALIRRVRRRWRMRVGLRGLLIVVAVGFLAFVVSVWGMDRLLYSERAIFWFRALTWLTLAALALRFLVLPLARRVSDEQIALYVEENEPSMQAALLSALELGPDAETNASPEFANELMSRVVEESRAIDFGRAIERPRLRKLSGSVALASGLAMLAILASPAFLQHGAMLLFAPWTAGADTNPYGVLASPGNIEVPRGSDLAIHAALVNFEHEPVELMWKSGDGDWQRFVMAAVDRAASTVDRDDLGEFELGASGDEEVATEQPEPPAHTPGALLGGPPEGFEAGYEHMLLNLQESAEYYIAASTVRTPIHRIDVVELPWVESIDARYIFPEYTGLEAREEEDSGDLVALRGTKVELTLHPTLETTRGQLLIDETKIIELVPGPEGVLLATLDIERSTWYRIELEGYDGDLHRASSEYTIQVIDDQPPILRFSQPGRDIKAHKIDEVFLEVQAEDDYGLGRIELVWSVTGGEETSTVLYRGGRREVTAGHTFFLEEIELEDGDFISYYGRAFDRSGVGGRQLATTDIYFIEIRPFGKDYRRMEGGGGQGGDQGGMDDTLSVTQRQIIAATFRMIRDRADIEARELNENLATVGLMQGRLREQVDTLISRMQNRTTLSGDTDFQAIIENLTLAREQMGPAEEALVEQRPKEALPLEQTALKYLQRAEAVFRDVRVSFDPSGGGGGGQQQQLSEDLADLFELELDKLRNQYETVQRGERQQTEQAIDEAMQKLRELARRQEQENERARKGIPGGKGGGSKNQNELIEETEKLARELETLARERQRPELQEAARRLREATEEMRRASAGSRSGSSVGDGVAALDRLRDTKRLLDKTRSQDFKEQLSQTAQRADRVQEMQERIKEQVAGLPTREEAASSGRAASEREERLERLAERKTQLEQEVKGLESELDRLARQAREESPEASSDLQAAANSIRDNQLKEKIRYSEGVARGREKDYAELFEGEIGKDIEELRQHLGEASSNAGSSSGRSQADALERARELVQSLESLESRLRERTSGEERGQQASAQTGQPGEQQAGQDGQAGEQGSPPRESGQQPGEQPGEGQGQQGQGEGQGQGQGEQGQGEPGARLDRASRAGTPGGEGEGEGENPSQADGGGGQGQAQQPHQSGDGRGGSEAVIGSNWGGSFQPGTMSNEEVRQFQRELSERVRQGRELSDQLRQQGLDSTSLDQILRQMNALQVRKINNDPLALNQLKEGVVEGLRQFEYTLWREIEGGEEKLFLENSDFVPDGYRELVEEYYRKLSRASK